MRRNMGKKEIQDELRCFDEYYQKYKEESKLRRFTVYGTGSLIIKDKLPKDFKLREGCLKGERISFQLEEMLFEYLNKVLCKCGYNKDKNERTTQSGIHDVSHMIYSTYCHYFVSNDSKMIKRANAIFHYLGIETEGLSFDGFISCLGRSSSCHF